MKLCQKLQQQGFNRNKEDLQKNDNINEWDTQNKQSRKWEATGDALSVAENRDEGKNKRVRGAKDGDQPKNRCVKGAIFVDVDEQKNKKKGKKPRGSKQELKGNQEETKHGSFGSEISDNAFLKVGHKEDVAVRTKKRKFEVKTNQQNT